MGLFARNGREEKKRADFYEKNAKKWANADNVSTPDRLRRLAKRKRDS